MSDYPEAYFVFNRTSGGSPSRVHGSAQEAYEEAVRLANRNPGHEFLVLSPTASVQVDLTPPRVKLFSIHSITDRSASGEMEKGGDQ